MCLVADLVKNVLVPGDRKPNSHWPKKSQSRSPGWCRALISQTRVFSCSRAEFVFPVEPRVGERWSPSDRAVPGRRWKGSSRSEQPLPTTVAKGESQVFCAPRTQRFSSYQESRETVFSSKSTDPQREMLRNCQQQFVLSMFLQGI